MEVAGVEAGAEPEEQRQGAERDGPDPPARPARPPLPRQRPGRSQPRRRATRCIPWRRARRPAPAAGRRRSADARRTSAAQRSTGARRKRGEAADVTSAALTRAILPTSRRESRPRPRRYVPPPLGPTPTSRNTRKCSVSIRFKARSAGQSRPGASRHAHACERLRATVRSRSPPGRCPESEERASEQRGTSGSCSLADEGTPLRRHDEVIRGERGQKARRPRSSICTAHPEIPASPYRPRCLSLDLI